MFTFKNLFIITVIYVTYCSMLLKCTALVNFVNQTPGMLYMVLIYMQNYLSLKIGNSLNPEFTLTLQGCYIFAMYNCTHK